MKLLADDGERKELGRLAQETMRSQAGATARTIAALKTLLADGNALPLSVQAAHTH
jgi:hypothetical protein